MQNREALLPGTDALTASTAEWFRYRNGYLVRYRSKHGITFREQVADPEAANARFWGFVDQLRQEVRAAKEAGRLCP